MLFFLLSNAVPNQGKDAATVQGVESHKEQISLALFTPPEILPTLRSSAALQELKDNMLEKDRKTNKISLTCKCPSLTQEGERKGNSDIKISREQDEPLLQGRNYDLAVSSGGEVTQHWGS